MTKLYDRKIYTLLLVITAFFMCYGAVGQVNQSVLPNRCKCHCYSLTRVAVSTNDSITKKGIVVKKRFIECKATFKDSLYEVAFGHQYYAGSMLTIACRTNQPGKLFNGHYRGKRTGIWFGWYPWGSIRKAVMYRDGRKVRKVIFRPNGNLALTTGYQIRDGKRVRSAAYKYDKEGFVNLKAN